MTTYIKREAAREYNPETDMWDAVTYTPCPFGVRDLQHDECYSGNGNNRCKYFKRYDFEKKYTRIVCACDLPTSAETFENGDTQYLLDFGSGK